MKTVETAEQIIFNKTKELVIWCTNRVGLRMAIFSLFRII